jgi:hypothetical protein
MSRTPFKIALTAMTGIGLVAGVLAGCAAQDTLHTAAASFSGYGLHYVDGGDSAKLAYGRENSDNVSLMMECAKGSGHVEISDLGRKGDGSISLVSDGKRSDFRGSVETGEGPPVVYTTARTSSPALQGFRETGKIEIKTAAARYTVAADESQKPMVDRFFEACGTAA